MKETTKHSSDGYEHFFRALDVWQCLGVNIKFHAWCGRNMRSGQLGDLMRQWSIPLKHILRKSGYKGDEEFFSRPGLPHDALSSLGMWLVIGTFAQVRGLALSSQQQVLGLVRSLCALLNLSTLPILPNVNLAVQEGFVCMKQWLRTLDSSTVNSLKQRPSSFKSRVRRCLVTGPKMTF